LHALQRALEIAQRRYVRGVASSLDVLDSRRSLYSAQLALVQARAQYLTATVDLYQALGGGWNVTPR
jgi:multidrug efflux system outer membrane protein